MSFRKPKIYFLGVSILICVSFILSTKTALGIPATFNLQGRVLNQSGQDVADGTYPMTFRIYTTFYGGSPIWEEEWSNATSLVSVNDSLFSVTLGTFQSLSDVDFSSGNFYLSIEFNHDGEMSPRKKLSSVPFSLYTSSLNDKISTDFVLKKGDTMLGNLNLDKHNLTTTGKVVAGEFWKGLTSLDDIYLKRNITGDVSLTGKLTIGSGLTVSSGTITLPSASIVSAALPTTTSYLGPSIESAEITDATITNTDISNSAAIAYSKLSLTGSITNTDISNTAAIAYTKLNIPNDSLTIAKTSGLQTALDAKLNLSGGTMTGSLAVSGVSGLTDNDIPNDLTVASTKKIQTTLTTEQMRLAYNTDTYAYFTVDSSGNLIIEPTSGKTFLSGGTDTSYLALAGANVDASKGINIERIINSGYYYGLYNNLLKQGTGVGAVYGVYNKMHDDRYTTPPLQPCDVPGGCNFLISTAYGIYNELETASNGEVYGVKTVSTAATDTGTIYAYYSDLSAGAPTTKYNLYLKGAPNYLYNTGEQLRIGYDTSNYYTTTVGSTGQVTFDAVGINSGFTFSDQVNFPTTTRHIALSAKDCESDSGTPTATAVGKFPVWRFTDGVTDAIHCAFDIPDDWSAGTNMTLKIVYSGNTVLDTNLYGVKWDLAGNAVSGEVTIDLGNAFSGTTTHSSIFYFANSRKVTAGITISNSLLTANNTSISIKITRDGAAGGDTYTGNADIHLIQIWYTSQTPKSS